jgi:hypothetical protein
MLLPGPDDSVIVKESIANTACRINSVFKLSS